MHLHRSSKSTTTSRFCNLDLNTSCSLPVSLWKFQTGYLFKSVLLLKLPLLVVPPPLLCCCCWDVYFVFHFFIASRYHLILYYSPPSLSIRAAADTPYLLALFYFVSKLMWCDMMLCECYSRIVRSLKQYTWEAVKISCASMKK